MITGHMAPLELEGSEKEKRPIDKPLQVTKDTVDMIDEGGGRGKRQCCPR